MDRILAKVLKKCECGNKGKCSHSWTVRYKNPEGRQKEKSFPNKPAANAFAVEVESSKNRGTYVDLARGKMTFKEFSKEWMSVQFHKRTTADTYNRHLKNHILPTFGDKTLVGIKPTAIQAWVKSLQYKGLAHSTIELVYNIFSSIMKGAVKDERLGKSPCTGVKLPEVSKTGIQLLTPDQVCSLANALPKRYRAMILVAAMTGLRQGEALGLCVTRVDFLKRKLTVDQQVTLTGDKEDGSKGNKPTLSSPKTKASIRTVPLPQVALEALSEHIKEINPKGDLLFASERGNPLRRDYFNARIWKPALQEAGLPEDTTFHDLRHTYASTALAAGVPITDVSKWLGHASITETVDTYGHLLPDADGKARAALDAAYGQVGQTPVADFRLTLAN